MASPLHTGKQSVNLASDGVRVSKIRRDPPPVVKEIVVRERDEREAWVVVIGVVTFALALVIIVIGVASTGGWTPRQHTVRL